MAFKLLSASGVSSHSLLLYNQLNRAHLFGSQLLKPPAWHFVCMFIHSASVILWIGASAPGYPIPSYPIPCHSNSCNAYLVKCLFFRLCLLPICSSLPELFSEYTCVFFSWFFFRHCYLMNRDCLLIKFYQGQSYSVVCDLHLGPTSALNNIEKEKSIILKRENYSFYNSAPSNTIHTLYMTFYKVFEGEV